MRSIRWTCRVLAAAFTLVLLPTAAAADPADPTDQRGTERLVLSVDHVDASTTAAIEDAGATVVDTIGEIDTVVVDVPESDASEVIDALAALEDVGTMEADHPVSAALAPNDTRYVDQWALPVMGAPAAWDQTTGSSQVVVAVIDTGVDAGHPDLAGSVLPGIDLVNGDTDPADDHGHGTIVAGIAAARGNNGVGVAGVCWSCKVLPIKALDAAGNGVSSNLAQGITWAADQGADVIVLSLSGPSSSTAVANAVAYAEGKGIPVVAAAGNDGTTSLHYPAANQYVIGVAGSTSADERYSWSTYGGWVLVAAPGCALGPVPGGAYGQMCGTSASAPLVGGAIALGLTRAPGATPAQVRSALTSTATPVPFVATGRINAAAFLAALGPTAPPAPAPSGGGGGGGAAPPATTPTTEEPTTEEPAPVACASDVSELPFRDVSPTSVHAWGIACAARWGIATGRVDGTYDPAAAVTRAQAASLLARTIEALGGPLPAAGDRFRDDDGSAHEANIDRLAAVGIIAGTSPTQFSPGAQLTRAQMATLLVRTHEYLAQEPLPAGADRFVDDDGSAHEANIDKAAAAGLVAGVTQDRFAPQTSVRRDQVATLVARLLDRLVSQGIGSLRLD